MTLARVGDYDVHHASTRKANYFAIFVEDVVKDHNNGFCRHGHFALGSPDLKYCFCAIEVSMTIDFASGHLSMIYCLKLIAIFVAIEWNGQ